MKGGGAGGGFSQVIPMEDINLHFNGDFHAITSAHNLLAASLDNHLHHGNKLNIHHRRIVWNRVLDLNDRALRQVVVGLGGPSNSIPRQDTFSITAASEIMAIFCLSNDINDLRKNIASIIIKLKKITDSIIVCDDGSSDLTGEIARNLGALVISHPKNLGYGAAIHSLFLKAKELDSDILITLMQMDNIELKMLILFLNQ